MATIRDYDHLIYVVISGNEAAGSSSFVRRVVDDPSNSGMIRSTFIDGENVGLVMFPRSIYDGALNIARNRVYGFTGTQGIVAMYDVNNVQSFVDAKNFLLGLKQAENYCVVSTRILVGNNDDMPQAKVVSSEEAQELANQIGIKFFETGSTNKNVEELFDAIARQVLSRMTKVEKEVKKKKKCCRCCSISC